MSEQKLRGFGVSNETKVSNNVKMLPPIKLDAATDEFPNGYQFSASKLVNIGANNEFKTKNGDRTVLQFTFKDSENRIYVHTEWALEADDEKYDGKMDALNSRIGHIYTEALGALPSEPIGAGVDTFFAYFQAFETAFKSHENIGKAVMYTKLVFNQSGNLNFPYAPNFLQRLATNTPCKLEVNLKHDSIEQSGGGSNIPGIGGGASSMGDVPVFEGGFR